MIDITAIGGTATIYGGDGNDIIRVNYDDARQPDVRERDRRAR